MFFLFLFQAFRDWRRGVVLPRKSEIFNKLKLFKTSIGMQSPFPFLPNKRVKGKRLQDLDQKVVTAIAGKLENKNKNYQIQN